MDSVAAYDQLAKLQQILVLTRREYEQYRLLTAKKLVKGKERESQLEQSRDQLRSAVLELAEQGLFFWAYLYLY